VHIAWDQVLQQVVNALSLGSIYALVAIGLAVVFSIMRLVNFAYGELLTISGYVLWALCGRIPWPLAFAAAIACAAAASVVMERVAFRPVRDAEPVTLLLTSFAVSVILQTVFLIFFGGDGDSINFPGWVQASFSIGSVRVGWLDVTTVVVTGAVLAALLAFLRRSTMGIALRAAAEDFAVTRLMGMNANRVITLAFALSGALAGVAGIFWLAGSGTVLPTSGFDPLIKGFLAAVIGGMGSLGGAAVAGVGLGCVEVFFLNVLPSNISGLSDAFVFIVIILLFLVRPNGLFSSEERVA
jgi:branched-chain amino acid transport system permease protein